MLCDAHNPLVGDVEGPGKTNGDREADDDKDHHKTLRPIGDIQGGKYIAHHLGDHESHTAIDSGYAEYSSAAEFGYEA